MPRSDAALEATVTSMQPMETWRIEPIDGEARVLDLHIASCLRFDRLRDIRKLIERNMLELERYGTLRHRGATPEGGGPTATEYWLNEGQALLICALSKTQRSADVRQELIAVFLAYREGQLVPPAPAADRINRLYECVEEVKHKVRETAANIVDIKDYLGRITPPRQDFSKETKLAYRRTVLLRFHRDCPCCLRVKIVDEQGERILYVLEYDHWYARHHIAIDEGWAVCAECNHRLENDRQFKESKRSNFNVFHQQRLLFVEQPSLFDVLDR